MCPADTHNNETNANACITCPPGTTTQGLTGQKTDITCGMFFIYATFSKEFSFLHFFTSEKEDTILYYLRILLFLQNI